MDKRAFTELAGKIADGTATDADIRLYNRYCNAFRQQPGSVPEPKEAARTLWDRIDREISPAAVKPYSRHLIRMAAAVLLLLGIGAAVYFVKGGFSRNAKTLSAIKATKAGERLFIRLPDGSTAVLNGQSELRYAYSQGHRDVFLKGEAYFTVKHNGRRPFIVHTGNVNTKDVGTVFNVNAYPGEEDIVVTVVSGSVAVSDPLHHYGLLGKDQLVYRRQSSEAVIQKVDPADITAWKEGKLIFNGRRLSDVVKCFKRTYNVEIDIDSRLKSCPLYADFSNLDIEKSVRLIAESLNARYEKTGAGYRITGGGCK